MMASKISQEQIQMLRYEVKQPNSVFYPGSKEYEKSLERWSAIGRQRAGVAIRPKTVEDLASTVRFAMDNQLDLAVKGGGHSTDTSSSSDGGILIDLGSMRQVSVNPIDSTVTAQGGALWKDVNDTAAMLDLAVVGGTASQTGVGGVSMRGGYGYLTPKYGLVLDNLLSAKVVTADGQVLSASANEHPDLFWAIRGAGANVGVAAELRFQAHTQPNMVWCGTMTFMPDKVNEVVEALNGALLHPHGNAAAQCVFALSPDSKAPVVTTVLFFNGPEEEGRIHFAGLADLECISMNMEMRPYAKANTLLDDAVPPGGRKKIIGVKVAPPMRPDFASQLLMQIGRKLAAVPELANSCLEIDYFDLSKVYGVSITETAFPSRTMTLNGALILQWTDLSKDEDYIAWGVKIQNMCENELRQAGFKPDQLVSTFFGYTDGDNMTPEDMFGVNADALLKVKRQYDPDNVFNKLNPLGHFG
ncbi:uncharacterized protein N7500_002996 [Penicillium coprophilum]|uniref:uncharacterized protein n=1 Tax=Penicillium coprophilum TaxID=36646 RepID=UPI002398FA9D|nr:uncharacterized protein N7500_002996 [Penicillium coprophilum]KAJ5170213.1 hypothetical protein N7500_002996 [Penicillium coprophilum]